MPKDFEQYIVPVVDFITKHGNAELLSKAIYTYHGYLTVLPRVYIPTARGYAGIKNINRTNILQEILNVDYFWGNGSSPKINNENYNEILHKLLEVQNKHNSSLGWDILLCYLTTAIKDSVGTTDEIARLRKFLDTNKNNKIYTDQNVKTLIDALELNLIPEGLIPEQIIIILNNYIQNNPKISWFGEERETVNHARNIIQTIQRNFQLDKPDNNQNVKERISNIINSPTEFSNQCQEDEFNNFAAHLKFMLKSLAVNPDEVAKPQLFRKESKDTPTGVIVCSINNN